MSLPTPKRSPAPGMTLARVMEQARALWSADIHGRTAALDARPMTGPDSVAPLFEWENPPPDLDVAGRGSRAIGMADVDRVLAARSHYEQMYRRVGGVPVRPRLVAHLAGRVAPLLDGRYDDKTGRALLRAVGGLVAFTGVCAYDASPYGQALAQRYFFHALRMAKASGDKAFGAYVVALLTNQALFLGDNRLAIQYAETALRAGRAELSPALQADLHAMQAKAGWEPGPMHPLLYVQPSNGIMTSQHHIYNATSARQIATIDSIESDHIELIPMSKINALVAEHKIVGATTVAALLYAASTIPGEGSSP